MAAHAKIRTGPAAQLGFPPPLRSLVPWWGSLVTHHPPLVTYFLIYGGAIKNQAKSLIFNHFQISNRGLNGLRIQEMQPILSHRTQRAFGELELDAQNPIEMKFLRREPFLQILSAPRVELRHHLAFLHVHEDALRRHRCRRRDSLPQFLRALPRQACQRVLRDVTSHFVSLPNNLKARNSNRQYRAGAHRITMNRIGTNRASTNRISSDTLCREKKQMPEPRTAHPYYLYDAIHAQPALIEKVLTRRDAIEHAADAMAEKERITFVGIGTSLHAAQIAELWMREFTAGRIWPHFEESFELVNHPIAFIQRDAVVVITHPGTTTASIAALRAARAVGALTVAITGELASATIGAEIRGADFHIQTCDQEVSFAYTKSYTTALAALT